MPDRLSRNDAAAFLGRNPITLRTWARGGFGPTPHRDDNGHVYYNRAELEAFQAALASGRSVSGRPRGRPLQHPAAEPRARRAPRESRAFHLMVVALRRAGNRLYRAGPSTTLLNGVRIANGAVRRFAESQKGGSDGR
jgi:hypothetical protein